MGGAVGGGAMLVVQDAGGEPSSVPTRHADTTIPPSPSPSSPTTPPTEPDGPASPSAGSDGPASPSVLLAWSRGPGDRLRLDPGLEPTAAGLASVSATSTVRAGGVDLVASRDAQGAPVDELPPGWAIPLDAAAIDPPRHAGFAPIADREAVGGLGAGEAVLGRTSAELRRLEPGGVMELAGGHSVVVTAVVDDVSIGGAELAVDVATGERLGITTPRYMLVAYRGDRAAVEDRLRAALTPGTAVRFRGPGETPFLRHADAVLPQAEIKARFGEFSYRPPAAGDRAFEQDPRWRAEHVVTVDVPILGTVTCHRGIIDALVGALQEIERAGLRPQLEQASYDGCFNPRLVSAGGSVSRHAWGVAFDVGFGSNPTGFESVQDPRVVEIFRRWGFTSGDSWLIPDAGHFEFVSPPV